MSRERVFILTVDVNREFLNSQPVSAHALALAALNRQSERLRGPRGGRYVSITSLDEWWEVALWDRNLITISARVIGRYQRPDAKRRTIWLSDEEWAHLNERAEDTGVSRSRAIVNALEDVEDWEAENRVEPRREPGPPAELTPDVLRAMGGSTDGGRIIPESVHEAAREITARPNPYSAFRPAPKPGKGR